ncbi:MAG: thiamine-phosphate kinase [Acidobacteriota bacterium]|nr:thiamine-phosphate kinase [Acidobacteriota bacterium]
MVGKMVGDLTEDDLIEHFFGPMVEDCSDDTALLCPPPGMDLLVSTDALIEEVHFPKGAAADLVAQKAVRANVSDIVASGGHARWLTLSLALPKTAQQSWLTEFQRGLADALSATQTVLVGGDTTRAPAHIALSMTVIGEVPHGERVGRSGARPGDWLAVTGSLGEAALGLDYLLGKRTGPASKRWIERHFKPPFRGAFSRDLAASNLATAMMDLSDGLAVDLPRLCRASGMGAEIQLTKLPVTDEARAAGLEPLQALTGGEDYELLCSIDPANWEAAQEKARTHNVPLTRIGRLTKKPGTHVQDDNSNPIPLPQGWSHFA